MSSGDRPSGPGNPGPGNPGPGNPGPGNPGPGDPGRSEHLPPSGPTGSAAYVPVEQGVYSGRTNPTARPMLRGIITYGIVGTVFLLSLAVLALEFGSGLGVRTTVLAAAFAALPLFVVVPSYLWLDRYEAEPKRFLVLAFLWGALCAAVGALLVNTGFALVASLAGAPDPDTLSALVSAPVVEEGLKGLGILLLILLRRKEFDGIIDGIVYAGMIGAGFAFSENILYLGRTYLEFGQEGLGYLFFVRCIMGPFAHPLFTACTGIGLGIAVSWLRTKATRVAAGLAGYGCAVLLHGIWNLSASTGHLLGVYFGFQVPLFLAFVGFIVWLRRREGRLIRLYLSQYADAGWLSHREVAMLASLTARRQARDWARQHGGRRGLTSMRSFQDSASDLALLRSRIARGSATPDAQEQERTLLTAVVAHRQGFIGTLAY